MRPINASKDINSVNFPNQGEFGRLIFNFNLLKHVDSKFSEGGSLSKAR